MPYVIVCLSRYLLSHLQILILHRLGSRFFLCRLRIFLAGSFCVRPRGICIRFFRLRFTAQGRHFQGNLSFLLRPTGTACQQRGQRQLCRGSLIRIPPAQPET